MRVISRKTLSQFWESPNREDSEEPLRAWYREAKAAAWASFADVRSMSASASVVGNDRIVFNIRGNKYRLVVAINYPFGIVYIRFIGTHEEYDKIDASTI